jgi:hypothetical protein
MSQKGRGRVKTLEPDFVRCIFSHVRSISWDFVGSNRVLWNLRGVYFEFSHGLGRQQSLLSAKTGELAVVS